MNAGELRHKITFEKATSYHDEFGSAETTWTADGGGVAWAAIRPASAREMMLVGAVAGQTTHTITLRYRSGISAGGHRVRFEGRTFDIAGVINVEERNVELRLLCHETTGGA